MRLLPVAEPEPAGETFHPDLITCGGGGAFLASTHHLPERLAIALQPWPTGSGSVAGPAAKLNTRTRALSGRSHHGEPRILA